MSTSPESALGPVIVGFDGSPTSSAALRWASDYAAHTGASLHIAAAAGTDVDAAVTGEVSVTSEVVTGKAAAALLSAVERHNGQLLVLGRRGRSGLASLLLGSVSDECANKAPCPVVVTGKHSLICQPNKLVVVGVDGSADADHALGWAADFARRNNARLHVISTWEAIEVPPDSIAGSMPFLSGSTENYLESDAAELLRDVLARCADSLAGVEVTSEACVGDPAAALTSIAAERNASLLVVGTRGIGGFRPLVIGSVARNCLHRAPCPVALTRLTKTTR